MQKDRKSKLAQAFMARKKKQLACYLASTLAVVVSSSLSLPVSMAFDAPPANGPANLSMGQIQVGNPGNSPVKLDRDQISNSEALKRVGIRFVGPGNANQQNGGLANAIASSHRPTQTPTVVQPPMVISGPSTESRMSGSSESSVEGIRIRIPSETNANSNPTSLPAATSDTPQASSSPNLKMTVGTGIATQPMNNATASASTSKPTFVELPSINASALQPLPATALNASSTVSSVPTAPQSFGVPPAQPQVAQQSSQAFSSLPKLSAPPASTMGSSSDSGTLPQASVSKLQEKLQTNSTMTSRAPGIVRIPSMVVTGPSPSLPSHSLAPQSLPTTSSPSLVRNGAPGDFPAAGSARMSTAQVETPSFESGTPKRMASNAPSTNVSNPASFTVDASFQKLPSTITPPATIPHNRPAMNSQSQALSTSRPTELPEPGFTSPISSSSQKLMEAAAKTNVRHEPSIIPVALTSTAKNDLPPSKDAPATTDAATTDALEINNDSQVTPGPSALANPSNIVAVALRNVQTIRLPGKVLQVEIEDDTICRVISTEPNTLTIIGATVGDSKITVWSTNPSTRASDSQDFRISVRETWGQAAKNSVSIDDVNQSIAGLFPGSEIVIKPNSDGSISVQGTATSNESAKQILMLVRKMFLVPVQDRIAIASL